MSQSPSVHPLDSDDDEPVSKSPSANPRTFKQTLLLIILITGALSFTITLLGAALISNAENPSGENLGTLLRILGGVGLITSCISLIAVTRGAQIRRFVEKRPDSKPRRKSAWFSLLNWNIFAFFLSIPLLLLVYLTLGTYRTYWLQAILWPFEAALIVTLAVVSQREYRAYWIGFAIMIAFFVMGYDMNAYLRSFLDGSGNTSFYTTNGVSNYQNPFRTSYSQRTTISMTRVAAGGIGSVDEMAFYHISRIAWAMVSGLLCSGIVSFILPPPKATSDKTIGDPPKSEGELVSTNRKML
jgi:MFS family permease